MSTPSEPALTQIAERGRIRVEAAYRLRGYRSALDGVWVRTEVAERLERAADALGSRGCGLLVWDGWRPPDLQAELYEEYRRTIAAERGLAGAELDRVVGEFVNPPDVEDPPPPHSTGGAVDLTLYDAAGGAPLDMGGDFDELTDRTHPDFYERDELTAEERVYRDRRRLLHEAMTDAGFVRFPTEWWHFEFGTAFWAQGTGEPPRFRRVAGPRSPSDAS